MFRVLELRFKSILLSAKLRSEPFLLFDELGSLLVFRVLELCFKSIPFGAELRTLPEFRGDRRDQGNEQDTYEGEPWGC